ncbi:2-octaprenyl-6-methoxyphenyl hydroxylase [Serratia microhaemolytica]|uniref:2-octaprenyl-6-methoxyphenyl hydroxylase n=1 Tax=Serratia microhaemolytica TaxID=2675110 RepID=UPI000FDE0F44|nr:2-octaprenyl-6-methoxyphenyl hydroxylase [Serratia microhaemolytica]
MSVIIVGGGMAGATLALAISALSKGRIAVDLIESALPSTATHPGFDARAIALAQGTCQQLMAIGIWPALSDAATAITDIHVSDQGHAGMLTLHATEYHIPALGQVIELQDAGQRLFALLAKADNVRLHCPAKVLNVQRHTDRVDVVLDNGQQLCGQLLVAADGSRSAVAQQCHISWQQHRYPQCATIATITCSKAPNGWAFERFTRHGPLALLPLAHGRCSLVWCHPQQDQAEVSAWSDSQFLQQLQLAFGWRLGKILSTSQRHCYPLSLLVANQHVSHRLALVGNAAQTLHPIAGQGFNLGLRDVISLAETLVQAAEQQQDLGDYSVLQHYQQRRQTDQQATINLVDGLVRLFANDYPALVVGRNCALLALSQLPMMRAAFTKRTLGWVKH